ncbi:MAG: hypothetical protein EDS66_13595 [Planctomycetota bacterium]|nr:MAG: hypothetical protein EDS66_13595 [Planctomycetota bacterium]MCQ3921660.1 hypothetical protein [Planctomycetota bacterium]
MIGRPRDVRAPVLAVQFRSPVARGGPRCSFRNSATVGLRLELLSSLRDLRILRDGFPALAGWAVF